MSPIRRVALGVVLLSFGYAAQAGLERWSKSERPALRAPLASVPLDLGGWIGRDEPVERAVLGESQADEYLNRSYESPKFPGRRLFLWVNYSGRGDNMRHSPEVCLPAGGWKKLESECRVLGVARAGETPLRISRLAYSQGELVQGVGFWYYIFGEGGLERYVRGLPITSRSSHGRTTRGSGMTVEVFCPVSSDPDGAALEDFAKSLLVALEPILPEDRAAYYVP